MNSAIWYYTNRRGLCTTFIVSYFLFVMVENLQCNVIRNVQSDTNLYPWQANLYYNESGEQKRLCSAALISHNAVITAAHCIHDKKMQNLKVKLGKSATVEMIKTFNFSEASNVNDLAILILRKNLTDPGVPIKVAHEDLHIDYAPSKAYFKSYNDTGRGTIELKPLTECWLHFPGKHICGIIQSSTLSEGDSGGAIWIDYNREKLAIGITSYAVQNDCNSINCSFIFINLKGYNILNEIQ